MKRIFLALALCGALMGPAWAQDTTTTAAAPRAAQEGRRAMLFWALRGARRLRMRRRAPGAEIGNGVQCESSVNNRMQCFSPP